jgi:hypothetical protein
MPPYALLAPLAFLSVLIDDSSYTNGFYMSMSDDWRRSASQLAGRSTTDDIHEARSDDEYCTWEGRG